MKLGRLLLLLLLWFYVSAERFFLLLLSLPVDDVKTKFVSGGAFVFLEGDFRCCLPFLVLRFLKACDIFSNASRKINAES